MLHHIGVRVSSLESAKEFYLAALAPLGYEVVMSFPGVYGLGAKGIPDFWISSCPEGDQTKKAIEGLHVAFGAENRAQVDQFYDAAMFVGSTTHSTYSSIRTCPFFDL